MFPLAGPLIDDVLAAEKTVFAEDEFKAPVAHRLNGDGLSVPTPLPPRTMLNTGVTRKWGEVAWEFLPDQELAVLAELVTDISSGAIDPDAPQPAVGPEPQPIALPRVPPHPPPQAEGGERETDDDKHHEPVDPAPGLELLAHCYLRRQTTPLTCRGGAG